MTRDPILTARKTRPMGNEGKALQGNKPNQATGKPAAMNIGGKINMAAGKGAGKRVTKKPMAKRRMK